MPNMPLWTVSIALILIVILSWLLGRFAPFLSIRSSFAPVWVLTHPRPQRGGLRQGGVPRSGLAAQFRAAVRFSEAS